MSHRYQPGQIQPLNFRNQGQHKHPQRMVDQAQFHHFQKYKGKDSTYHHMLDIGYLRERRYRHHYQN